jgi:sulfate adenylyltransferase large subunit
MKIVIVGHVDHGKSTLIGRILHDTNSIPEDKVSDIRKKCLRLGKDFEFAFLLDALEEEQEQTITIDTTQIFFRSPKRNYMIIDAPGHKEFLKNMVSGASNAEAAILMVDACAGIEDQTYRHAYILSLLGIENVLVVINKMDIENYSESRFRELCDQIDVLFSKFNLSAVGKVPVSAKEGENIMQKSMKMDWYSGSGLMELLDSISPADSGNLPLRFPVQDIYKWDERIIAGRVESGILQAGNGITFYPSMKSTKIGKILKWNSDLEEAAEGECVGFTMSEQLFVERGEIASLEDSPPAVGNDIEANIFWMGKRPLKKNSVYSLKILTSRYECEVVSIKKRIDPSTMETIQEMAPVVKRNEVGNIVLRFARPFVGDVFSKNKKTGRFVLLDGRDVAGGGIITSIDESGDAGYLS